MELKVALKFIYDVAGIFILWIIIHYVSANLYSMFCAELSIFGFVKSVFVSQTPYCVAMRWVIYNGGNAINSMWFSVALWITTKLFNKFINE